MIGRCGERGSGISVLVARHDNDDDDIYIYIYIYIYIIPGTVCDPGFHAISNRRTEGRLKKKY